MVTLLDKKPNAKQQQCIDKLKGQVMVLAGPGTGKTFTLIERIKNMLSQSVLPEKILCLTFSDAAASEMKKRLISDIGPIGAKVNTYTYHSFCNEIIANNPDDFIQYSGSSIISDSTKRAFVKQCIDELNPKALRTEGFNAYYFIPEIIKAIEEIKKNLITKDEFFYNLNNHPDWGKGLKLKKEELAEKLKAGKTKTATLENKISELESKIEKSKEIWAIYEKYRELMLDNQLSDFNDMINVVLEKFKSNPGFATKISNEFEYLLVDEYQDTNKAQNMIVFSLLKASESKNIFVVGDDDQIIYGFQGAQLDNVEKFLKEFPTTEVICLNENMRSTQEILDYSYEIDKHLVAKNPDIIAKNKKIKFYQFEELEQEQNNIVKEIKNLVESADCPIGKDGQKNLSEIAIITRTNAELNAFADKLKSKNIPFELKEGANIFGIKSAVLMILYMKLLADPIANSDKIFALLLNKPFSINPKDYEKLLTQKHLHRNDFFINDIRDVGAENFENQEQIEDFLRTYEYLKDYSTNENLKNTVLEIANKTGILKYFLSSEINKFENIMAIKKLIDEADGLSEINTNVTLEDFVEYLTLAIENEINIYTDKSPVPQNAVQLLTYHSSKGREFEYVYLPTLETYKWERNNRQSGSSYVPISTALSQEEKDNQKASEKIKLLFVGVTRAKHSLILSYPIAINKKSRSLTKFVPFNKEYFEYREFEYDSDNFLEEKIEELIKYDFDYQKELKNYLKARVKDLRLSATAINTYLQCPQKFFFEKIMEFATKEENKDNMNYGNSVHRACQKLFNKAKEEGKYPSKSEFIKYFEDDFANRPISTKKCRNDLLERGRTNLPVFYVQLTNTPINNLYCAEYKISDFQLHGVKINGFIDRIEKLQDGTFALYDYKTGKSKTSEIEDGKKHEDYLNQLRLYKLLFEKITGNIVSKTGFIFPDDCLKNCEKPLCEADNALIEQKLIETNDNILNLNFEAKPKDAMTCKYCPYKDLCSL